MKKLYLILLSVFAMLNTAMAQELKVKSFVLTPTDITAQTEGRKDLNGDACALVKISFVGDVADVEGNVIKPLVKRNNETWAFMTQESRQMKVVTKNYLPLMVTFGDYGIEKLQGNRTYVLTLANPSGSSETQQMQTLTIKYSPITASVLVDNKFVKGSKGVAKTSLPIGQHSYIIACDGYESEEGTVKLKASAPSSLQITLSKEAASKSQPSQSAISLQAQPQQSIELMPSIGSSIPSSILNTSNNIGVFPSDSVITFHIKSIKGLKHLKDGISIEMVKVEASSFDMGATPEMKEPYEDEMPVHRVTLTNNYYIGKYEVTQGLWQAVMGKNPSRFKGENLPVDCVSWKDCQKFLARLKLLTGKEFRLPTEAEWEYAARGGKKSRGYQYSGSSTLSDVAWYDGNSVSRTHAVGTKQPNELGIYDMTGNVWEWCQDWKGKYCSYSQTNPISTNRGVIRVRRGGGCGNSARDCRSSCRYGSSPNARYSDVGLRLVLSE